MKEASFSNTSWLLNSNFPCRQLERKTKERQRELLMNQEWAISHHKSMKGKYRNPVWFLNWVERWMTRYCQGKASSKFRTTWIQFSMALFSFIRSSLHQMNKTAISLQRKRLMMVNLALTKNVTFLMVWFQFFSTFPGHPMLGICHVKFGYWLSY